MTISKRQAHSKQTIAQLEHQLTQLQMELAQAKTASKAQSSFLANMAHELRTPLNSIIGFAQILDNHTELTAEQEEYLGLILLSGESLLSLINDILQMSKIESGNVKLNTEEFDLHDLLHGIDTIYYAKAIDKNLNYTFRITGNTPRYILGDRGKIRQILFNLLSNAIKFTDRGSITLNVHAQTIIDDPSALNLIISVQDTGRGIRKEELSYLFQPYQQTETGRISNQGTGLGLAITKELAEMMRGHVTVQSEWQSGTKFTATLMVGQVESNAVTVNDEYLAHKRDAIYFEWVEICPETIDFLRQAASTYSLEQVQKVIPTLPQLMARLVKERVNEFDFEGIITILDTFEEQKKSAE
ncbi:MAG: HAMP domain-containing sensor histidine kinase [Phototrophicaceae bacterium]